MDNYDSEELFWKHLYTEEEAKSRIIWGAKTDEEFNAETERDANFIIKRLDIQKDDIVLDYGCGIGRLMKPISKVCNKVVGLDVSNPIVAMSKKYLKGRENIKTILIKGDGTFNLLKPVDKVFSYIVLQHINKYKVFKILTELKKGLVPGGRGLFQFPDLLKNKDHYPEYANDFINFSDMHTSAMNFWTIEEAKTIFEIAGWRVVDVIEQERDFWVITE